MPLKLIVGLGNPGPEYDFSPHNMGFAVVDRLALRNSATVARKQWKSLCGRLGAVEEGVWLIKPQTFMNLSGTSVKEWLEKQGCSPAELLVIADEMDLPWGSIRIRERGGAAGHHGLESVIDSIGSQQFARLRIGVRPDHPLHDAVDYLLSPVKRSQREEMGQMVDQAAEAVEMILKQGMTKAMNKFNQRAPGKAEGPSQAEGKS